MIELCSFDNCENHADVWLGNNINKGRIPLCEKCCKLYTKHTDAREKMFREEGVIKNDVNEVKEE